MSSFLGLDAPLLTKDLEKRKFRMPGPHFCDLRVLPALYKGAAPHTQLRSPQSSVDGLHGGAFSASRHKDRLSI